MAHLTKKGDSMNEQTFLNYVEAQHAYRLRVLKDPKKKRSLGSTDRLLQFTRLAALRQCSEESAAIDLATKHFTDILDMAEGSHPERDNIDYWRELVADIQNYLDITLALAEDRLVPRDDTREIED